MTVVTLVGSLQGLLEEYPSGLTAAFLARQLKISKSEINPVLYGNKSVFKQVAGTSPPLWVLAQKPEGNKFPPQPDRLDLHPKISQYLSLSVFGNPIRFRVISQETSRNDLPVRVEVVGPDEILVVLSRTFSEDAFPGVHETEISSLEASMTATALLLHVAGCQEEISIREWESEYGRILRKFAQEREVLSQANHA